MAKLKVVVFNNLDILCLRNISYQKYTEGFNNY